MLKFVRFSKKKKKKMQTVYGTKGTESARPHKLNRD